MSIPRRTLLRYGLLGAGLLAVGGVGLGLRPGAQRQPARPLRALDAVAFSTLAAIADRVCPGGTGANGARAPSARELQIAEKIDDLLATCEPGLVAELNQALHLFENAVTGLLFNLRPSPFTLADGATQDRILEDWRTSRLHVRRQVYKALRTLCASTYFAMPEAWPSVGYPGPPDFSAWTPPVDPPDAAAPPSPTAPPATPEVPG
jgi:hypothetical protein